MDRDLLRGFERVAVPVLETINRSRLIKRGLHATVGWFNCVWITAATGKSWEVHGLDTIKRLDAPQGMILVANHLSFFDMYIGGSLIDRKTHLMERVCFPVRANWHYQGPIGVLLNTAISGAAMWPPVFRDGERRKLNHTGLDQMADFLGKGASIGIHPEGRRNKTGDPYTFLPPKPGLGLLVERCHPDVAIVPYFIIGLTNDWKHETTRWARKDGERGEPIRIRFAEPIRAGDVREGRTPIEVVETVMAAIHGEAMKDKAAQDNAAKERADGDDPAHATPGAT